MPVLTPEKKSAHTKCAARRQRALAAGFFALLLGPGLLCLALHSRCDTTNYENRTLTPFPGKSVPISDWPSAFESWLEDNAPFRNSFLSLKAGADLLTGSLDSDSVLQGRDGWLFLKDVSDSRSLSDYQGITAYTEEETRTMAETLTALNEALAARGSKLVILFAPAKEGVYAARMPTSIPVVSRPTRVEALTQALSASGVPVVFPLELLRTASETQQVYYKYDTHWNDPGAWLAAQQVFAALGLPYETTLPQTAVDPGETAPKDLANLCGRWNWCTDDLYYKVNAPTARLTEGSRESELTRYQGDGSGTLLLARDSFGAALGPHLAEGFDTALVLHTNQLTVENLLVQQPTVPDAVVLEVGERFSDNLQRRMEILLDWVGRLA